MTCLTAAAAAAVRWQCTHGHVLQMKNPNQSTGLRGYSWQLILELGIGTDSTSRIGFVDDDVSKTRQCG